MSLQAHYNFNENDAANVWDYSCNEHHATVITDFAVIAGNLGIAGVFNGASTELNFGNILDFGGDDKLDIFCEIYRNGSGEHVICYKEAHFELGIAESNRVYFKIEIGAATIRLDSIGTIANQTYTTIGAVYDKKNMYIYINGEEDNSAIQVGNLDASSNDFIIGNNGVSYLNGRIEMIEIRNDGLSADNMSALHENPTGIKYDTYKDHGLLQGDLIGVDVYGGDVSGVPAIQSVVTYVDDLDTFRAKPIINKINFGDTPVRRGNIYKTARQWVSENRVLDGQPIFQIIDELDTFDKYVTNTPAVKIGKEGIYLSGLTPGQVVFPDGDGLLTGDSNLVWDNVKKVLNIGTKTNFSDYPLNIQTNQNNQRGFVVINTNTGTSKTTRFDIQTDVAGTGPRAVFNVFPDNYTVASVRGAATFAATNVSQFLIGTANVAPVYFRTNSINWMTLTPDGFLGLGTETPARDFEIVNKTSGDHSFFNLTNYSTNLNTRGFLTFRKSHNNTKGNLTATIDNEILGSVAFYGVGSSAPSFDYSAFIQVIQDGAAGTTRVPTEMLFGTSPGGTIAPITRIYIKPDGKIGVNFNNPAVRFQVAGDARFGDTGTNYLTIGTTGKTYWTGSNAGLPYGYCYGDHLNWTQNNAEQNTWYPIGNGADSDMISGLLNLTTHNAGLITVTKAGIYMVGFNISHEENAANVHMEFGVEVNGVDPAADSPHIHTTSKFSNQEQGNAAIPVPIALAAGETIQVSIRTIDTGTPNFKVDNIHLSCVQVGG